MEGKFDCVSKIENGTCVDEMICPNDLVYLKNSYICQRSCESLFDTCGVTRSFTGCGCLDGFVMSPDVRRLSVNS